MSSAKTAQHGRHHDFWVLLATILAPGMVFMLSTAIHIALPAVQRELGASGADLLWIINSYAVLQVAMIFLGGSLGDHYGRRRVFFIGTLLFVASAVAGGLTTSSGVFIAARVVQGIGSGLIIPCSLALVAAYFEYERRGWSIAIWSAFTMFISGLGPIAGGWLIEMGLWRFIFFANIPLGIIVLITAIIHVPESYDEEAPKALDIPGAVLSTVGLALGAYAWTEGAQHGFSNSLVVFAIGGTVAMLLVFIWVEGHSDHAMMPLHLFRSRTFSGANVVTQLLYAAINALNFFLPLNLIQIQGYSETAVGFALLPMTILMGVISLFMGNIVDRYGPRLPLIVGPLITSLALAQFAGIGITTGQDSYWSTFLLPICLFGTGMGITLSPLTIAVMGSVQHYYVGIASGINNTIARSSQVLGIAILGGLALTLFNQALVTSPIVSMLPPAAREQLAASSVNLAETAIPDDLTPNEQADVENVIKESFSDTIRVIMWISAGLSLLSALLAALMIEKDLHEPEFDPLHDHPDEDLD